MDLSWTTFAGIALGIGLAAATGCADPRGHAHAVYLLVDTSGTYAEEIGKAQLIVNYLLGSLQPGDSLAVARVRSRSFSEKDIIAKATFDNRPSQANAQKRVMKTQVEAFTSSARGSVNTDITGGLMVAFNQTRGHWHRVSDVGEAFATDTVDRKLAGPRWPHVHAGEIADRVVVLRVAQPTQRHRPGITGPRSRFSVERRRDPAQQLFPLGLARLRRVLRRHVATAHPLGDIAQRLGLGDDRLSRAEAREIEIVVLGFLPVADPAGFDK